jgi:hypothetical protein
MPVCVIVPAECRTTLNLRTPGRQPRVPSPQTAGTALFDPPLKPARAPPHPPNPNLQKDNVSPARHRTVAGAAAAQHQADARARAGAPANGRQAALVAALLADRPSTAVPAVPVVPFKPMTGKVRRGLKRAAKAAATAAPSGNAAALAAPALAAVDSADAQTTAPHITALATKNHSALDSDTTGAADDLPAADDALPAARGASWDDSNSAAASFTATATADNSNGVSRLASGTDNTDYTPVPARARAVRKESAVKDAVGMLAVGALVGASLFLAPTFMAVQGALWAFKRADRAFTRYLMGADTHDRYEMYLAHC